MYRDYNFLSESVCLSANQICGQAGWRPLAKEKIQPKTEFTAFFLLTTTVQQIILYFYNSQLLPALSLLKSLHSCTYTE